jgi:hypothetical protein
MTEPEVSAAQTALDALPPEWLTPLFVATVQRRAGLQAVHRKVAAQVAAAQASVASTLSAIEAGDVAEETLAVLVAARAALAGALDAQSVLPAPALDSSEVHPVIEAAGYAMSSGPQPPIVLDYDEELVRWRSFDRTNSGQSDPPLITDADRAVQSSWRDADDQVTTWRAGASSWQRDAHLPSIEPLNFLASAQSYIERAASIVQVVEAVNVVTAKANAARKAAGLNWAPPLPAGVHSGRQFVAS